MARDKNDKTNSLPAGNDPKGLKVEPTFADPHIHPFEEIVWEHRSARIGDSKGSTVFEQNDVEFPVFWSQLATNVVASKYFYGEQGTDERESSLRQLVHRVTRTITDWGKEDGLFASDEDAENYYRDLTYLCANQYGAFNSPVWFNVGLYQQNGARGSEGNYFWDAETNAPAASSDNYEHPQGSACFIQSVDDTMEDIMRLARDEAMLFKYGSGTGTDLSTLRSSREKLSGGGTPSGPLSFMRVFDQIAGVVKSGGKTRRAAKMQSLRVDHPDVKDFIECKTVEEKKAWALIEQGYDGSFNGDAYASVMYQNANLSVRVTDDFMDAVDADADWTTRSVTTGEPVETHKARELMDAIAEGTHVCGDPGLQYHTTINRWHTCKDSGEICASNPCSEYMFLNDSACNLASLNLMKFVRDDGSFDVDRFRAAVRIFIVAQEILVDHCSYPSALICKNSHDYRPLGLGYANLGATLMMLGLPYDSDHGRAWAGAVTAILTGQSYRTSAELASVIGTFDKFAPNRRSMLDVMHMHRRAVDDINHDLCPQEMLAAARMAWDDALDAGEAQGYRNAQVTVLAPTGTIGFMMDCDTTGIEPEMALVRYKQLAGGGSFKLVNQTVPEALRRLGYDAAQVRKITEYIDETDTIEGAPDLAEEHLPVFDCAFKAQRGTRAIHHMGHIRMMGAVQCFISGAISKTVNVPNEITADEIGKVYMDAWRLGLKAVAIYRDGSKRTQPVSVGAETDEKVSAEDEAMARLAAAAAAPARKRLPATRPSITHKFSVAQHEGYLNVGMFEDGKPGELFITMAKEGSTVGGLMDAFATAISLCLQYGVQMEDLVKKFSHQRFEPNGMTANRDIPFAKSIVDYIFRWLGMEFLDGYREANAPRRPASKDTKPAADGNRTTAPEAVREDVPSEPGRAVQTDDKEVKGSDGALNSPAGGYGMSGGATPASVAVASRGAVAVKAAARLDQQFEHFQADAPPCDNCGSLTVRNGNCYKCHNCGASLGCS
jgi:ribonucleoside-diphosphate reductase alpha chain